MSETNDGLTELQRNVAVWWARWRMAENEEECRKALNGAINTVREDCRNKAIDAIDKIKRSGSSESKVNGLREFIYRDDVINKITEALK